MSVSISPLFLTYQEVSQIIPVSAKTLRNRQAAGTLPFPTHLVFGKRLVKLADVRAFADNLGSSATTASPSLSPSPHGKRGRPSNASRMARKEGGAA